MISIKVKSNKLKDSKELGFTLLEILVSVIIFSLIIIGAQQVFSMASANAGALDTQQKRLRQLNIALQTIERDMQQLVSRSVRGPGNGFSIEPLQTDINDNFLIKLTRGGWKNPLYAARPEVQAATYYLKDDKLMRSYYPYLDSINDVDLIEQELLNRVETVEIKFLDRQFNWVEDWPSISLNNSSNPRSEPTPNPNTSDEDQPLAASPPFPIAVEFLIELEDHGVLRRLINVAPGA